MARIFIGIITQNDKKNIEELTSVYKDFDGLAAVDHYSTDGTYELLKQRQGNGFVVQSEYQGHHATSMNLFLHNKKIEDGDWILLRDGEEKINPQFSSGIYGFINMLESKGINTVLQYSKLLLFKRFPQQFFYSTPHWGFSGRRDIAVQIENQGWFQKDEDYCYSVRNKNRHKYHFVRAYCRYYLILDSNHSALGLDKNIQQGQSWEQAFSIREEKRRNFRKELINNGYECSMTGIDKLLDDTKKNGLPKWAIKYFNNEKILNDLYRHEVLGLEDFNDDHAWDNMVKI